MGAYRPGPSGHRSSTDSNFPRGQEYFRYPSRPYPRRVVHGGQDDRWTIGGLGTGESRVGPRWCGMGDLIDPKRVVKVFCDPVF